MNRKIQLTAANCMEYVKFDENLKSVIPEGDVTKFSLLEPNQELQLDFLRPLPTASDLRHFRQT